MSPETLISIKNVSKCFPIFLKPQDRLKQIIIPRVQKYFMPWMKKDIQFYKEFWALKNISFDVKRGETVGIVGRNGSGKSTLLQIVCGILKVNSGSVELKGRVAALLELGAGFNPEFTGRENVYMNATILGLTNKEIEEKFESIVDFSEIGEFIDRPVKTYSSGMFMRLAFSVATSVDPDVVIVDESLSVGDVGFTMKCMQRIDAMRERGVTLLLVSHDLSLVKSMCSRVLYLKDRECVYDGDGETATELFLMDVRNDQAAMLDGKVVAQPVFNQGGMAFGSGLGRLLDVKLSSGGQSRTWFYYAEAIDIDLRAWVSDDLGGPALAIGVRDYKGVVIGGFDSRAIGDSLNKDDKGNVECRFSLHVKLLPGVYNLVVRILDFPFGASDILVEKQLNAATIEIISNNAIPIGTHGLVSLGGICEQGRLGFPFKRDSE